MQSRNTVTLNKSDVVDKPISSDGFKPTLTRQGQGLGRDILPKRLLPFAFPARRATHHKANTLAKRPCVHRYVKAVLYLGHNSRALYCIYGDLEMLFQDFLQHVVVQEV